MAIDLLPGPRIALHVAYHRCTAAVSPIALERRPVREARTIFMIWNLQWGVAQSPLVTWPLAGTRHTHDELDELPPAQQQCMQLFF